MDYFEIIVELNMEMLNLNGHKSKLFRYSTNGFDYTISFDGIEIWNSYEDGVDSKDFISFIRNKYHEKIKP